VSKENDKLLHQQLPWRINPEIMMQKAPNYKTGQSKIYSLSNESIKDSLEVLIMLHCL
jgi:hypothetical protein